jgi:hypothetical protein
MIISITLVIFVTISGAIITYLYDRNANLAARLCSGACIGLSALGIIGFVAASFLGLDAAAILLATGLCSAPILLLAKNDVRKAAQSDIDAASRRIRRLFIQGDTKLVWYFLFYAATSVVLWNVFNRAMIQDDEGIGTGLLNNYGDLPFHLSVVTGFAFGHNYPPEDPTYAGIRFTYPFISDFISAIFVRCGADLPQSLFIENFVIGLAFVGLLHRWALVMLGDRLAAVLTPLIAILNGGFGWVLLFSKASDNDNGLFGVLSNLPPSFTVIPETTWRWGNAVSTLLVPQRGFLLGLPLAVIAFTQWWLVTGKEADRDDAPLSTPTKILTPAKRKKQSPPEPKVEETVRTSIYRMIAAGVAAGLLPLVHAHSFVVVMGMAGCIALLQLKQHWRQWLTFFIVASIVALPQLWWSTSHSAVKASSFFAIAVGWDHGQDNPVWFWFKNTGIFIPVILVALLSRGNGYLVNRRLLVFYLPFTLCFIIPNFIKMAPWIWDNIKVLYYWWLASAPIVALLLARLWHQGSVRRLIAVSLFVCITLAGALDVAGIALRSVRYGIFDVNGIRFAELIKQKTEPRSLVVHAPIHNTPVFLTGRRSLMGYPGHIWTHGLEFVQRESEIKRIYAGAFDAEQLMKNYGVDYVVVGPLERSITGANDQFFSRFEKVGEVGEYALYKIKAQ